MDRSKRATNPDNYNEDGTYKTGHLQWTFSKNYGVCQYYFPFFFVKTGIV